MWGLHYPGTGQDHIDRAMYTLPGILHCPIARNINISQGRLQHGQRKKRFPVKKVIGGSVYIHRIAVTAQVPKTKWGSGHLVRVCTTATTTSEVPASVR